MDQRRDTDNPTRHDVDSKWRVVEWKPTLKVTILWTIFGTILTVVGFLLFTIAHSLLMPGESPEVITINLLLLLGLVIGVLILHEAIHGLAALMYGARPQFGVAMLHRFVPVLYCTTPGHFFSRRQFAVFALAPLVVISALGVLAIATTPWGLMLIAPLAVNFGGAVGDIWFIGLLLQQAPETLVEDQRDGVRFHVPIRSSQSIPA